MTGLDVVMTAEACGRRWARALALTAAVLLAVSPAGAGPWDDRVREGRRLWSTSPDPANPVACATCHHDPAETRGWAASFPKFKPLPPPHGRVMTLGQATAEAVAKHYGPMDVEPVATAIAAYLTDHGMDQPVQPGIDPAQPVFPGRMRALARSARRGEDAFGRRCAACHAPDAVAGTAVGWWSLVERGAGSAERFLEAHAGQRRPLAPDSPEMADLLAYLAGRLAGRPLGLAAPMPDPAQEVTR